MVHKNKAACKCLNEDFVERSSHRYSQREKDKLGKWQAIALQSNLK